jgi:hypothetical protein
MGNWWYKCSELENKAGMEDDFMPVIGSTVFESGAAGFANYDQ